jgi:malonate transporter and related proteins
MVAVWHYFILSAPLFAVVAVGYLIGSWRHWQRTWTEWGSRIVFALIMPAMLFGLMSDLSALPPVDARLLIAFFGGCFLVFGVGRLVGAHAFAMDGVSQSVFALGGIFSNNLLLGLPIAKMTLGEVAVPSVALVLVFNSLTLWTLVSVSIEWARHGSFTPAGFGKTALSVLRNPIVASILVGTALGLSGLHLPAPVRVTLDHIGSLAAPAALLVLGMGLAEYEIRRGWRESAAICALKLLIQPMVVGTLGFAIGLPPMELKVIVLLASMAVGANVYLVATQFQTLQGTIASSLVLSTALAAITTPLLLAAVNLVVG